MIGKMAMPAMGFGLSLLLLGLFGMLISVPLSTLVTNWHLFLRQEEKERYRSKKVRGIRILAKLWIALGGCIFLAGCFVWILKVS